MSDQPSLFGPAEPPAPDHRVLAVAGVLAGFRWPGRPSFEKLKKGQQAAALDAARLALARLAEEPADPTVGDDLSEEAPVLTGPGASPDRPPQADTTERSPA